MPVDKLSSPYKRGWGSGNSRKNIGADGKYLWVHREKWFEELAAKCLKYCWMLCAKPIVGAEVPEVRECGEVTEDRPV